MKLEQTKKEKAIQDMFDRDMSPNKIFQENKMGMSRSSIYNRKKRSMIKIFLKLKDSLDQEEIQN